jgi:hypothetical protein
MNGVIQRFDPAARMWSFYLPTKLDDNKHVHRLAVENVRHTQAQRIAGWRLGAGPRFDALKDSLAALNEGRYRFIVAADPKREVFAFKQTVGTGKLISLPH